MRPLKLAIRIPVYRAPRNAWRERIHRAVTKVQRAKNVSYLESDRLEITLRLYLGPRALEFHDIDNRLKDCLDALQGRAGGKKAERRLKPIVPNDRQIWRASVAKSLSPKQAPNGLGHLTIRRLAAARPVPR